MKVAARAADRLPPRVNSAARPTRCFKLELWRMAYAVASSRSQPQQHTSGSSARSLSTPRLASVSDSLRAGKS
eukprot:3261486-Rhodomonas_salina.1